MVTFLGDWSNHDWRRGEMDFASMRRDGILGGAHKTTDGLNYYLDPYVKGALPRMRDAFADGVYGSYHVLWGNRDLGRQVDWWFGVLDVAAPGWRDDPRFFLMSDNEPFGYNAAPTVDQVNRAGDLIAARVPKVMAAYCPPWHYGPALEHLRYPLVSSNYGSNPAVPYLAAYPGPDSSRWMSAYGKAWALQYGSRTVMGSQATCDANAFGGSVADFQRFMTGTEGGIMAALTDDQQKQLYNAVMAIADGMPTHNGRGNALYQWEIDGTERINDVRMALIDLLARPAAGLTDEQVGQLAAALVARPDNPLGAADQPAIREALRAELANLTLRAQ